MTAENHDAALASIRGKIDDLDIRMFDLLAERLLLAHEIGRLKREANLEIVDRDRETSIIENLESRLAGKLDQHQIRSMTRTLLELSHEVQQRARQG